MIPAMQLNFLPGMKALVAVHRAAGQQPDTLCGPYWIALMLKVFAHIEKSPSEVGELAGSVLPLGDPVDWIPAGASPRQDYKVKLPHTERLAIAGTSIFGLMQAVQQATGDRFSLIPVQADWTAQRVQHLLNLCQDYPTWRAIPIANWNTSHLWGSAIPLIDILHYLNGDRMTPPPPDWDVGHFAVLAGQVVGSAQSLVVVQDTYPMFGWDGYHLQPYDAIAQALNRPSDRQGGGILFFVQTELRSVIERVLQTQGFRLAPWDNGTPWPLTTP